MKQRNKEKRLRTRQKAYDDLMVKNPEYKKYYTRPGSMKK